MSYKYFQPRTRCHSAFQHYTAFHWGGGDTINIGSNNTTIFNCGGHTGGFWGGFGLGLGNAFGSIFGGLFGGGMGFGGMGGFGLPSFGGLGNLGGLGGSSDRTSTTTSTCNCNCGKDKTGKAGENDNANDNDLANTVDKDQAKLSECINKLNTLKKAAANGQELDPNEVSNLRKTLTELKSNPLDELNGATNKDHYGRLLDDLNKIAPQEENKNGKTTVKPEETAVKAGAKPEEKNGNEKATLTRDPENNGNTDSNDSITVNGKPVKIDDLNNEAIRGLTPKEVEALKPEQAKKVLAKLGIKDGGIATDTDSMAVLLLLQKAGITVKLAQNKDKSVSDEWIIGKISDVEQKDKKISYKVDCNNDKSTQKNKYVFKQKAENSKTFIATIENFGSGVKYANSNIKSVEYTYGESNYLSRQGKKFTTTL